VIATGQALVTPDNHVKVTPHDQASVTPIADYGPE